MVKSPKAAPKGKSPKAAKPELKELGPHLAALLNPALNRQEEDNQRRNNAMRGFAEIPQAQFDSGEPVPALYIGRGRDKDLSREAMLSE
ncbi:MAG: hypothetical protein NTZ22_09730, partial [Hyphomicrobiales bacterium]|nr:hypothetical protein [Hyphomicrobiales bacterium]